jgi:NAD(P)-dependent dehydrogenase (short-subunit alcohol dehydrogenase family)
LTELRFDDQVTVVTGGGRGIGRCHALLLASRGARVVVADHGGNINGWGSSHSPANAVVQEIADAGGQAVACHASVADERGANEIITTALDTFGRIDAVINNAGIHDPGLFEDLSIDQFQAMLDVHYFGTLLVTRAAWRHFIAAGYGRVVNTVSEAMFGGIPELSSYGAAKGAVFGLTRNLATEGHPHGIRVNAIAPRAFTRLSASHSDKVAATMSMTKEMMDQVNASMPPEMCAPAAAYLSHESCSFTGEVLQIGMGSVARLAMTYSSGLSKPAITVEDIAENIDTVMNLGGAEGEDGAQRQPGIMTAGKAE